MPEEQAPRLVGPQAAAVDGDERGAAPGRLGVDGPGRQRLSSSRFAVQKNVEIVVVRHADALENGLHGIGRTDEFALAGGADHRVAGRGEGPLAVHVLNRLGQHVCGAFVFQQVVVGAGAEGCRGHLRGGRPIDQEERNPGPALPHEANEAGRVRIGSLQTDDEREDRSVNVSVNVLKGRRQVRSSGRRSCRRLVRDVDGSTTRIVVGIDVTTRW